MATKSGKGEKFSDKLKQWFKSGKASTFQPNRTEDFQITEGLLNDLSPSQPTVHRLRTLDELKLPVKERKLQSYGIEMIYNKISDMLQFDDKDIRLAVWDFLEVLIGGQHERLENYIMRGQFFRLVQDHPSSIEDLIPRLRVLAALTNDGKDLVHFEEQMGPFLVKTWPLVFKTGYEITFLHIVVNMIKFNSAYLDAPVITGFVKYANHWAVMTTSEDIMKECLLTLDAIVCYSYIPQEALIIYIGTLCHMVNVEHLCEQAWHIMKNLMGTHLGHSAVYSLSNIIHKAHPDDFGAIRGAVCFLGLGLWSGQRIKKLEYSPRTVLPIFVKALDCRHPLVTFEVIVHIEKLVLNFGSNLDALSCDAVVSLLELLISLKVTKIEAFHKKVHGTLDALEALLETKQYAGSQKRFFDIIDLCSEERPESSVVRLLTYRANNIIPSKPGWIRTFNNILDRYYKHERKTAVRIKTLDCLQEIVLSNRHLYEAELVERIVVPVLQHVHLEVDMAVKKAAIRVLTTLIAECMSKKCVDLLEVIEKVLSRPLEVKEETDSLHEDVQMAIEGLIHVFRLKLYQKPGSFTRRVFMLIVKHLEVNYEHPEVFRKTGQIRIQIFKLFMSLRANGTYNLGVANDRNGECTNFSPFVYCRDAEFPTPPSTEKPTKAKCAYLSLTRACMLVITCLEKEQDWTVLELVLRQVPSVLQNKALISRYGHNIALFVTPLAALTDKSKSYPEHLYNTPPALTRSEFHNRVFPVLAALAPYNEYLDSGIQQNLIRCLEMGLLNRECNRICITALTACTLEMKHSMYNLIPEVLLNLSKISATKTISIPMLEYLSTLIRLPEVFSSFIDTHYMSVFAIALPFTNPLKFDPYVVAFAHHVIIMWFLKCRPTFRPNFVRFIINALNSNVNQSFEEGGLNVNRGKAAPSHAHQEHLMAPLVNEDSSSRKRSSSLSNEQLKPRERHNTGVVRPSPMSLQEKQHQRKIQNMLSFNTELTETCIDLLARYMFYSQVSPPQRLTETKFLLRESQSSTWLLGSMLITITTSKCDQNRARSDGLCDRCHLICSGESGASSSNGGPDSPDLIRKRHQSAFQTGFASPSRYKPGASTKEEFDLRRQMSAERLTRGDRSESVEKPSEPETKETLEPSQLEKILNKTKEQKVEACACWCNGWAEIFVRRPSGDVSWMCRIQNPSAPDRSFPYAQMNAMLQENFGNLGNPEEVITPLNQPEKIEVDQMSESDYIEQVDQFQAEFQKSEVRAKSPVKKTHSVPEVGGSPLESDGRHEGSSSNRQSCDPIPEAEEEDLRMRRKSIQDDVGAKGSRFSLPPEESSDPRRPPGIRDRAHTISGPSPRRAREISASRARMLKLEAKASSSRPPSTEHRFSGVSPQFVFLQLYHSLFQNTTNYTKDERPWLVPQSRTYETSIKNLDRIPPYETHKIGVVYIGEGQVKNETGILRNEFGSMRYIEFMDGLGDVIDLREIDKSKVFVGGLDANEGDGEYAYLWMDDVMQVIFHIATLMPNHDNDPQANKKKRHIGNDSVMIVYNNSGERYEMGTIKGQFIYACVMIVPLDQGSNKVWIECKPELRLDHFREPKIVSDRNLSTMVRQVALHCNLASHISRSMQAESSTGPYASNWLERLRHIRRLKQKLITDRLADDDRVEKEKGPQRPVLNDFTELGVRPRSGSGH